MCALRWTDVDADAGTLVIRRSIATVPQGTVEKDTKTHAARRIAIDDHTAQMLNAHREKLRTRAALCGCALREDGYVFSPDVDGAAPLHPNLVSGRFRGVCRHLGVSGVRLHDLRHLHATQLLGAGVPVRTVSGRLGHADAATTLNVYAHFLQASDRQAADVISELLHPR